MKKEKKLDMISRKTLVSALTISMAGSSLAGCGSAAVQTADHEIKDNETTEENSQGTNAEADALLDTLDVNSNQSNEEAGKEETVYLFADSEGNVNHTLVSGWLKNPDGDVVIKDVTDLKDVVNVKGDEDFEKNGDEYLWKANGKDIYYQGTTDKAAPVTEKITYYLDGEEISAEDLAGKSGRVTIRFDYENSQTAAAVINGKEEEVKVPFAVVTGMILNERFRNISVENGRLVSDGNKNVVIGFALPGLRESLDLDSVDTDKPDMEEKIKVPDYVEVTADVEDFELDMTLTVAASSADLSFDESLDFSDLDEKIDTLSDSSTQLADGTSRLADGIQTLKDSLGEFSDGVASLKDGVIAYTDGAAQLGDGIDELKSGTDSLDEGAGALADGINSLSNGAGELKNGIDSAKSGAEQLAAGINGAGGAKAGAQQLAAGAAQLQAGLDGDPNDRQNNPGAVYGAMGLEAGIKALVAGIDQATEEQLGSMKKQLLQTEAYYVNMLLSKAEMPAVTTDTVRQVAKTQIVPSKPEDPASAPLVGAILHSITNEATEGVTNALQAALGQLAAATGVSEEQLSASYLKGYQDGTSDAQQKLEEKEPEVAVQETDAGEEGQDDLDEKQPETTGSETDTDDSEAGTGADENGTDAAPGETDTDAVLIGTAYSGKSTRNVVSLKNRADGKYALISLDDTGATEQGGAAAGGMDLAGLLESLTPQLQGAFDQAEKTAASVGDIQGAVMAIEQVLDQVDATEMALQQNPTTERSDIKQLLTGAAQLTQGMQALSAGAKQLAEGTAQLNAGIGQLGSGATELANGMGQLSSGSGELLDGAGKLRSGSNELKDGTSRLRDGAGQLQEGARELNDNSGALKDGVSELYDGTGQVVDGVSELYDGAGELLDGMIRFDEEGIQKIADAYHEDVKSLTDRVRAVSDAGGSYDNFCGKAEDSKSSVKFIIRTEPVKAKDAAAD